ncbi:hypothetical protein RO3G_00744 [Rhizopus delemar RA 99-880]|uniref:Uncharacterized protein n=1 Tax=Rhizopus delemar (strain RA 99-880 / ATCC MYA-4621 / FGSC 9543 / NRRL 43880) TaxID=246409 RepID=I1BIL0_RHIO9|nr:hypothetical protein RO3G_00744 [Rhizopus delemar RA 99-880]|eukprot:EIE76040.1 hypothetical protein RO3G_00744 [Rhizopus delemar RA 99-880]
MMYYNTKAIMMANLVEKNLIIRTKTCDGLEISNLCIGSIHQASQTFEQAAESLARLILFHTVFINRTYKDFIAGMSDSVGQISFFQQLLYTDEDLSIELSFSEYEIRQTQ